MKQRNGFVSNSSSSSFIIAIKKQPEACQHCGRSDLDFIQLINNAGDLDSCVDHEGAAAVLSYMEELEDMVQLARLDPAKIDDWERDLLQNYNKVKNGELDDCRLAVISLDQHNQTLE
ncbi:unnamed protein product, partial [marine sediment metagenome]